MKRLVAGHLGVPVISLRMVDRIMEDLGADSLDQLELIMTAEEVFRLRIGLAKAQRIETLADLVEAIGVARAGGQPKSRRGKGGRK